MLKWCPSRPGRMACVAKSARVEEGWRRRTGNLADEPASGTAGEPGSCVLLLGGRRSDPTLFKHLCSLPLQDPAQG